MHLMITLVAYVEHGSRYVLLLLPGMFSLHQYRDACYDRGEVKHFFSESRFLDLGAQDISNRKTDLKRK